MPSGSLSQPAEAWPLIGREHELSLLSSAFDDAACGGVALVGAAGLGKTRLANEARELAQRRGLTTVSVRASRSASGLPLAALAPLFAELAIEPEGAMAAIGAVARALDERDPCDRLVLVVDDAQELDEASAALLDRFVGRPELFLVLTVRGRAADSSTVLDMWKEGHLRRVEVGPLPERDAADLVRTVLGDQVDGAALRELVSASNGNVLFLRELVTGALESGALVHSGRLWRLTGSLVTSPRLQDLIHHRLGSLTATEREALELVALSEPVALSLLASIVPLEVAERLEARHILEAVVEPDGLAVRLAHPLYGEAVRADLSGVRQARLCRALATALEESVAGEELRPRDALRVAVWLLDAGAGRPDLSLRAAKLAFMAEDYALAARTARHAWRAGRTIDAARMLVDSLEDSGELPEAESVLREAYGLAESDADRASLAARLATSIFVWSDRAADAEQLLADAIAATADPACHRLLRSQLATLWVLQGRVAGAIELGEELLSGPEDSAYAQATRDLGVALTLAGRSADGIRHTEAALSTRRSVEAVQEHSREVTFLVARSLALRENGRLEEARTSAEAGYAAAVERQNRNAQAWFSSVLGLTLLDEGRLTEADRYFRETTTLFEELGHPGRRWGLGGIALAAGQGGDATTAAAAIAELDALPATSTRQMDVHVERGRAWALAAGGDLVTARRVLWAAAEMGEAWGQYASEAAALHDLVRIDPRERPAAERLAGLADRVDGDLMRARLTYCRAVTERDADAVLQASEQFERCGAYLFAAEAASTAQRLHADAGRRRQATSAGARAALLAEHLDGAHTPALAGREEGERLSARELEIALLAASGATSKEIAAKLYLSIRTVDNHLQHAYTKLGVASRADLAERLPVSAAGAAATSRR